MPYEVNCDDILAVFTALLEEDIDGSAKKFGTYETIRIYSPLR